MNNKVQIQYKNFNPQLHFGFPTVVCCKVYKNKNIVNTEIVANGDIEELFDDFGYDKLGKYYTVTYGQWHHITTGEYISVEDYSNLDDTQYDMYEYVSFMLKFYDETEYRTCYHNSSGRKAIISFIPYSSLNFNDRNSNLIFKI